MNTKNVKFLAVLAVLAMAFATFAVITDESDAADEPTYIGGKISETATYDDDTVIIDKNLTIEGASAKLIFNGKKLVVNSDVTLTIKQGEVQINAGELIINGSVVLNGGASAKIINESQITINGSLSVLRGGIITGTQDDAAENVIVLSENGVFEATSNSSYQSLIQNQTVGLAEGATFSENAALDNVYVTAYSTASFYQSTSVLVDAESIPVDGSALPTTELTFSISVKKITAVMVEDNQDADFDNNTKTVRSYAIDVAGTLGSSTNVYSLTVSPGIIAEKIGSTMFYEGYKYFYIDKDDDGNKVIGDQVSFDFTVTDEVAISYNSNVTLEDGTVTEISGILTKPLSTAKDETGILTNNAEIIISGIVTINDTFFNAQTGKLTMDGGMLTIITTKNTTVPTYSAEFFGAWYFAKTATTDEFTTFFASDLDQAIEDAAELKASEVHVFGDTNSGTASKTTAVKNGAYVISDDLEIPKDMTLLLCNGLYVPDGVTLVFADGADFEVMYKEDVTSKIFVAGTVIDCNDVVKNYVDFETSKKDDDTGIITYTSLVNAMADAVYGDVITVNGAITISKDLTIPEGITVSVMDAVGYQATTLDKITLTVDGILNTSQMILTESTSAASAVKGVGIINFETAATISTKSTVAGVYFDNVDTATKGPLSHTFASIETFASLSKDLEITKANIFGAVETSNVTIIQNENEDELVITVDKNSSLKAGTVTLVGNGIQIVSTANESSISGTISADITSGTTVVKFASSNVVVSIVPTDDGEKITTKMTVKATAGTFTAVSGTVDIVDAYNLTSDNKFVVASGATVSASAAITAKQAGDLNIAGTLETSKELTTAGSTISGNVTVKATYSDAYAQVLDSTNNVYVDDDTKYTTVSGTLTLTKLAGTIKALKVTGTLDAQKGTGTISNIEITGIAKFGASAKIEALALEGELTMADSDDVKLTLGGNGLEAVTIVIGENPYDTAAAAVISGNAELLTGNYMVVYPGSDISGLNLGDEIKKTTLVLNGVEYATVITSDAGVTLSDVFDFYDAEEDESLIPGVSADEAKALQDELALIVVGDDASVSLTVALSDVGIRVSAGVGIAIYVDDVLVVSQGAYALGDYPLSVGTHKVSISALSGYDVSKATITFDGKTVANGGSITIDSDSEDKILTATGAVEKETPTPEPTPTPEKSSDFGITEILLVVLVILIAIMVVVVILRLNRS